jgi:hypothetical protein
MSTRYPQEYLGHRRSRRCGLRLDNIVSVVERSFWGTGVTSSSERDSIPPSGTGVDSTTRQGKASLRRAGMHVEVTG